MPIPAICIAGWANAGKTTLIERLLPILSERGVRTAVVKHSHHPLEMDKPGADTQRYRSAGADCVYLAACDGTARLRQGCSTLSSILSELRGVELILVEGFDKEARLPTIEVWRDPSQPLRSQADYRRAVVTELPWEGTLPCFVPTDVAGIADFLLMLSREQAAQPMMAALCVNGHAAALTADQQERLRLETRAMLMRLGLAAENDAVTLSLT